MPKRYFFTKKARLNFEVYGQVGENNPRGREKIDPFLKSGKIRNPGKIRIFLKCIPRSGPARYVISDCYVIRTKYKTILHLSLQEKT